MNKKLSFFATLSFLQISAAAIELPAPARTGCEGMWCENRRLYEAWARHGRNAKAR